MLFRLAIRPDRRAAVAALGIAAALLLPAAGVLVGSGLEPRVTDPQWLVVDAEGLTLRAGVQAAAHFRDQGALRLAALDAGDGPVDVAWSERPPTDTVVIDGTRLPIVQHVAPATVLPTDVVVPAHLLPGPPQVALYGKPVPGAVPARGPDAFEAASLEQVQASLLVVVYASIPIVAFLAASFADLDARRQARTAATLSALGRPDLGRALVAVRVAGVTGVGLILATGTAFALWQWGGTTFHPSDTPKDLLALALGLPFAGGLLVGLFFGWRRVGNANAQLRAPPELPVRSPRIPWLPLPARPLMMGLRVVAPLILAAMVFVLDVGFPLAAAAIPSAIAGGDGEFVQGLEDGAFSGKAVPAGMGDLLMHADGVEASIAEVLLPTLVHGVPVLVRGAHWSAVAQYYGVALDGSADGLVMGSAALDRLDLAVGDVVSVQGRFAGRVAWVQVTGVLSGHGLLEDEAVLPRELAQDLSGLDRGKVNVVRVRPDTPQVLNAMSAPGHVEVTFLDLPATTAGTQSTVTVHVANWGASAAERRLVLRVNDQVADTRDVHLAAFSEATVAMSFIVPDGAYSVHVNPTEQTEAAGRTATLEAPGLVFTGDPIPVHLDGGAGTTVRLGSMTAILNATGDAVLYATTPGDARIVAGDLATALVVLDAANRTTPALRVQDLWIDGSPIPGNPVELHARIQNLGGAPGSRVIDFFFNGARIDQQEVTLDPGADTDLVVPFLYASGTFTVEDQSLDVQSRFARQPDGVQRSSTVRAFVADRVLGDATRSLGALGAIAMTSSIAVVYLATQRTVAERAFVASVLDALGVEETALRRRVAWEAAILGAAAFLLGALLGVSVFLLLHAAGWPTPFAHRLPQPLHAVLVVQVATAFAAAAALAAYLAYRSKSLRGGPESKQGNRPGTRRSP